MQLDGMLKDCKLRTIFYLMDLPIDDKDLEVFVNALALGGDARLYHKLKEVKQVREMYPGGPYKKILREQKNMII